MPRKIYTLQFFMSLIRPSFPVACVASVSVGIRGKELPRKKRAGRGGGGGEGRKAPFAGERRFSKSRGLSASVSFLPLPHPLFLILAFAPISRGQNTFPVPFLGLSLLPNPTETLAMQATFPANYSMHEMDTHPYKT